MINYSIRKKTKIEQNDRKIIILTISIKILYRLRIDVIKKLYYFKNKIEIFLKYYIIFLYFVKI